MQIQYTYIFKSKPEVISGVEVPCRWMADYRSTLWTHEHGFSPETVHHLGKTD